MAQKCLAILGMRRSGTSIVSLYLSRLGVSFGDQSQLFRGNEFNRDGYWEHKKLTAIHRQFRMSLNLQNVECDPTPADWRERPASEFFLLQAEKVLGDEFGGLLGPWAWKDPDASLALPFVWEVANRMGLEYEILICVRNPMAVAASEGRRTGAHEIKTVGAWLAHTLCALHGSIGRSRRVLMHSRFLQEPRKCLEGLLRSLELDPSTEAWNAASAEIKPELIHSSEVQISVPDLVLKVYRICAKASEGENVDAEITEAFDEFEITRRMFAKPALSEAILSAGWERGEDRQFAQVGYRVHEGWQTVSLSVGALPASFVTVSLYPLPANVWIRNVWWRCHDQVERANFREGKSSRISHQLGLACVSLLYGVDHLVVKTPPKKGPFSLEIELLVETNNLIVAKTYKILSEIALQR